MVPAQCRGFTRGVQHRGWHEGVVLRRPPKLPECSTAVQHAGLTCVYALPSLTSPGDLYLPPPPPPPPPPAPPPPFFFLAASTTSCLRESVWGLKGTCLLLTVAPTSGAADCRLLRGVTVPLIDRSMALGRAKGAPTGDRHCNSATATDESNQCRLW